MDTIGINPDLLDDAPRNAIVGLIERVHPPRGKNDRPRWIERRAPPRIGGIGADPTECAGRHGRKTRDFIARNERMWNRGQPLLAFCIGEVVREDIEVCFGGKATNRGLIVLREVNEMEGMAEIVSASNVKERTLEWSDAGKTKLGGKVRH